MPALTKKLRKALRVYSERDGTRRAMNMSSIGEKSVTEFFRSQYGKTLERVERYHPPVTEVLVTDEPGLIAAAKNSGIALEVSPHR